MSHASRRPIGAGTLATLALLTAPGLPAQPARLVNARVECRTAPDGLERAFRGAIQQAASPSWIGYAVPVVDGRRDMCCYRWVKDVERSPCAGRCRLEEEGHESSFINADGDDCVLRAGGTDMSVLFRVVSGAVERIRAFSDVREAGRGRR